MSDLEEGRARPREASEDAEGLELIKDDSWEANESVVDDEISRLGFLEGGKLYR